ncbi:MAG: hypothetical protein IIV56_01680, partial [Mailhella sp.]|nr:hypothetical protein [Mailhella sp.]
EPVQGQKTYKRPAFPGRQAFFYIASLALKRIQPMLFHGCSKKSFIHGKLFTCDCLFKQSASVLWHPNIQAAGKKKTFGLKTSGFWIFAVLFRPPEACGRNSFQKFHPFSNFSIII